jgi:hypothetical protein
MGLVIRVGAIAQHSRKVGACAFAKTFAQRFRRACIGQLNGSTIGKPEREHVQRVRTTVLAEFRAADTIAPSATKGVGRLDAAHLVPTVATAGATPLRTQWATASAMEQRSVAGGVTIACSPFRSRIASIRITSLAMHSPGPVIGGSRLNWATSVSR